MFDDLQIYDRRERLAVGLADWCLRVAAFPFRRRRGSRASTPPERILVLRLERIGDLLMTFDALGALRAAAPRAQIDLVVGSWNASLAETMKVADRVEPLDAPWLARDGASTPWAGLLTRALGWRKRRYDLAINIEPDIRSNLLLGLTGARDRVGFSTGGGGAFLTQALAYDPKAHTSENAIRLVEAAVGTTPEAASTAAENAVPAARRLQLPVPARDRARHLLAAAGDALLIGVHASGGRHVKQWHPERFAQVAIALGREYHATIVLTGTGSDAPIVRAVREALPADIRVIDTSGDMSLIDAAAVLERLALYVTGDTGPMHLAAAVGTPIVAVFGASDPARYAPLTDRSRVVRVDLPCSPCNRIRRPPERCVGHVPDCLEGVTVEQVLAAARDLLPGSPIRLRFVNR